VQSALQILATGDLRTSATALLATLGYASYKTLDLYDVETHTINYHLKKVFSDSELVEDSVIRNFRITAADGKSYDTTHYNLAAILQNHQGSLRS